MVPDIAKSGHSFKGAAAYYLHDKGQQSAERVAWTDTRNLLGVGPHTAVRMMIATASEADELKRAAGIKATGRKSKAHVYAYSLAWHPDEAGNLDKAEMLRAVDQTLTVLGAQEHQALIVCHQDQKHPHVHVILNRVHPVTGVMLSTSNDRLKLSDWANGYERERGLIVTPKREEKRQLREQFAEKTQRREYAAEQLAEAKRDTRPPSPAAMLRDFQTQQRAQHRAEWKALSEGNKAARERIFAETQAKVQAAIAEGWKASKSDFAAVREQGRSEWRDHSRYFAAQARNQSAFALGVGGALGAAFGRGIAKGAAEGRMREEQQARRDQVARQVKERIDGQIAALKDERTQALQAQRQAFDTARAALIEKQDAERAKIRQAWQQIPRDRQFPKNGPARSEPQAQPPARNKSRADRVAERSNPKNQTYQRRLERHENRGIEQARKKEARDDRAFSQARQEAAPKPEQIAMKERFNPHGMGQKPPAPNMTTEPRFVAKAQPAPAPVGAAPTPPPRTLQNVPKTPVVMPEVAKPAPKVNAAWAKSATPAQAVPASRAGDAWSKAAPQEPRTIKPMPTKSKDRDRER